jgi:hypothetical protein
MEPGGTCKGAMETQVGITTGGLAAKSSAARDAERRKRHGRTRITNGNQLLPHIDGRSIWARLLRDTYQGLLAHCGGADMVSETQRLVARRIGVLEAELIHMEDSFAHIRAAGGAPDPASVDLYGRLADRQRRLADPLRWQRTPRDVTPASWGEIAAEIHTVEATKEGDTT